MQTLQAKRFIISEEKDNNLIKIQFLPETEIYEDMVKEALSDISSLSKETKVKLLFDAREVIYYDKGVCKTYSSQSSEFISSMAILSDSLASRIMTNYFMNNYKPNYPVRIFSNISEAENWLRS